MVERTRRHLEEDEYRIVVERHKAAQRDARAAFRRFGLASGAVCAVLCVLTLLVSDVPPAIVIVVWTLLAVTFALWTGLPERRAARRRAAAYASALAYDRARVTRIRSDRVVAFEEIEDEGASWAFDAGDGRTVFVVGQAYDESAGFPSSDVTFVEVLLPNGTVIDELVLHAGTRLEPERRVPGALKPMDDPPEHLEIVETPLDQIGVLPAPVASDQTW